MPWVGHLLANPGLRTVRVVSLHSNSSHGNLQRRDVNVGDQAKGKINHGFARIFTDQSRAENHEQPILAATHFLEKIILLYITTTLSHMLYVICNKTCI